MISNDLNYKIKKVTKNFLLFFIFLISFNKSSSYSSHFLSLQVTESSSKEALINSPFLEKAINYYMTNQYEKAFSECEQLIKTQSDNSELLTQAYLLLGFIVSNDTLNQKMKQVKVIEYFEFAKDNALKNKEKSKKQLTFLYVQLAKLYQNFENDLKAIEYYKEVFKTYEGTGPDFYARKSLSNLSILFEKANIDSKNVADFFIQIAINNPNIELGAKSLFSLAMYQRQKGLTEKFIDTLNRIIKDFPNTNTAKTTNEILELEKNKNP